MNETAEKDVIIRQVVVVGGGIAGLSAAYTLQQESKSLPIPVAISLIEADQRLGGKIVTEQVGGFTIEGGPDCFIRQKPWAAELAKTLGLKDDLLDTNDHQRKTYVLKKGRLTPLPDGVMLIVPTRIMPFVLSPLFSWPGKIRMGLDWFIPKFKGGGDESIGDFIRRRLGREALERLAEPLLSGIHVSDPEKQSLLATFPRFRNIEQKHGSLIRGMLAERKLAAKHRPANSKPASIFQSFKQGVGRLTDALEKALSGCTIYKSTKVTDIQKMADGRYQLHLNNGQPIIADAVILAIPSFNAADLLHGISPTAANQLNAIPYVSTATISMAFRKQEIKKPFMGFGFVIPRTEKRDISACTWSSFKFDHRAPSDHLLLRCFVGGPGKEEMVDLDDAALVQVARKELAAILGLTAEPVLTRVYRWRKANPQYEVGHLERVQQIFATCRNEAPGIYLTGSAYEGVGIPDCIYQGKKAAVELLQFLQQERVAI
jgi:protoporphyrinogen/coproporphyrinogen III oxidase